MNQKLPLIWLLGVILIGCSGSDRINGDSKENYQKSIISMTKRMSQDERSSFMDDIALLNRKHGGFRSTVDDPDLRFLAYLNGKSVSDIVNESLEIKRQDKIAAVKNDISLSGQRTAQLKAGIAAKIEEITRIERSILAAKMKEESDKAGAVKAKEILDKLVIAEAKFYRTPKDKQNPWMRNLTKERVEFKIINETEYLVEIEKVTIESGNTKIVLTGGFGCKGLASGNMVDTLMGADGKIKPKTERKIQCEIQPNQDIGDSGTIEISGGRVEGVGEYNVAKSPFHGFGEFSIKSNEKSLEESWAELESMESALTAQQASVVNSCNELAGLGGSDFLCQP